MTKETNPSNKKSYPKVGQLYVYQGMKFKYVISNHVAEDYLLVLEVKNGIVTKAFDLADNEIWHEAKLAKLNENIENPVLMPLTWQLVA